MKRRHRYSSFPVLEPDNVAYIEGITVSVYLKTNGTHEIRYSCDPNFIQPDTLEQIKQAIEIWATNNKLGGLSLQDYINGVFDYKLP
jgi:hypothetical protein